MDRRDFIKSLLAGGILTPALAQRLEARDDAFDEDVYSQIMGPMEITPGIETVIGTVIPPRAGLKVWNFEIWHSPLNQEGPRGIAKINLSRVQAMTPPSCLIGFDIASDAFFVWRAPLGGEIVVPLKHGLAVTAESNCPAEVRGYVMGRFR